MPSGNQVNRAVNVGTLHLHLDIDFDPQLRWPIKSLVKCYDEAIYAKSNYSALSTELLRRAHWLV